MGSTARRLAVPAALLVALGVISTASAAFKPGLRPIRRTFGEVTVPRLRVGTLKVPAAHARGRVRVVVRLGLQPLARTSLGFDGVSATRRLDVSSAASRAYVARLVRAQNAAAAQLRRAIPQARVQERYQVIFDGFAVDLPVRKLPTLVKLPFAAHVYPSARFVMNTNRSPAVIGADALWASTGARGDGIKIGVVDDGVDMTNPYFNPAGFSYPPGFPKGQTKYTTPKIIAARAFAAPGAGKQATLPLYRAASFHGTHVAGIAAGDAGTTAPAGPDHPTVTGLSGVAPRAQIGNYRVFSDPTPAGYDAFTPEIIAAFEAAVRDGMNVINFSGGGPAVDPVNDPLLEAVDNTAAAGVVPVISAGNDRDEFGLGSVGTPSTAPDAISVAAVSNLHWFGPALSMTAASAPTNLKQVPFGPEGGQPAPASWGSSDQTLVDPGTIVGTDGRPVDRQLCGKADPNDPSSTTLPAGSLTGAVVLVFRGSCSFDSKARRAQAAGAIGIVVANNRAGETDPLPVTLVIPGGMVSDLDGARMRDYLDSVGGRAPFRVSRGPFEVNTGRSGIVTSFSSAGPNAFTHSIKPDLAAPGGQILSSTLPEFAGEPFAVFDGTSMAAPHVTGAAALLRELHPSWTPQQVKSALVSTAGPAWADTARTQEAPVELEGSGLIDVSRANQPQLFTDPVSLSFGDLDVNHGTQIRSLLVTLTDAGGGAGTWNVSVRPQTATAGSSVDVPGQVTVPPGGIAYVPVRVGALATGAKGDDQGFVVLSRGGVERKIPYLFLVTRPGLELTAAAPLRALQIGDTGSGASRASDYRFPAGPLAQAFSSLTTPTREDGAEKLYVTHLNDAAVNLGVSILAQSDGVIDPFILGAPDENRVQGYAATPFDVNGFTFDYLAPVEAAAADFPRQKAYYVAVDSPRDVFTGKLLTGRYLLNAWVNDVTPPSLQVLTTRVAAGRPTLAVRSLDFQSGVDPFSLVINYRRVLLGASAYDPFSGIAIFGIPRNAPAIPAGRMPATAISYDYQETKNVDQAGNNILPNTRFRSLRIRGVRGPALTWLFPTPNACAAKSERLVVLASDVRRIRQVRFTLDGRRIGATKTGSEGLYGFTWKRGKSVGRGKHVLRAQVVDAAGKTFAVPRSVRVCG